MRPHVHLAPGPSGAASVPSAVSSIRVVLADDHEQMLSSLRMVLDTEEDIEVIAEARDLASVERHVNKDRPQVLVLDLSMPDGSGMEAISWLRERMPETQIVALTMEDHPAFAQRALAAGALGFVVKDLADEELAQAVRAAAHGEEYISPRMAPRLKAIHRRLSENKLTSRELKVLRLIALGNTTVEIARKLRISQRTVENHRAHLLTKLKLDTPAQLLHYALGRGLLGT